MSKAFSKGSAVICPFFMHSIPRQIPLLWNSFCSDKAQLYQSLIFFLGCFPDLPQILFFSSSLWSSLFYLIWSILASMPHSFHGSCMSQQPDFVVFLAPRVPFLQSRKTWDSYQIKSTNLALPDNLQVINPSFILVEKQNLPRCVQEERTGLCVLRLVWASSQMTWLPLEMEAASRLWELLPWHALLHPITNLPSAKLTAGPPETSTPVSATASVGQACVCVSLLWCARSWLILRSFHLCQGWELGQLLQGFSWTWDGLCEEQAAAGFIGEWHWSSWVPQVPECM